MMKITADITANSTAKKTFVQQIAADITTEGFTIVDQDTTRPWGAFFVIDPKQTDHFAKMFFGSLTDITEQQIKNGLPLTPKILVVAPHQQLSWQYHHRRGEIWHIIAGPVALAQSDTDQPPPKPLTKTNGDSITLKAGQRHRLIGLETWGVVAEIWLHTDATNPSNEDDIIRLEDNYGRSN